MGQKIYYKIVEERGDEIFTLFHGINGTKKLPRNKWITAEIKKGVMDGHGTKYTSGIHIVDGFDEAIDYAKKFRRTDRIIVPCYALGLKPKAHSRHKVLLANKIKIIDCPHDSRHYFSDQAICKVCGHTLYGDFRD